MLFFGSSQRLASIGVRVSETMPDRITAIAITMPNSENNRPTNPPMNTIGRNTADSDTVIDNTVKPISREAAMAASIRLAPCSAWRTMFSMTTMASSTTKPTDRVSASIEMLSRLKCSRRITAKVPISEVGSTSATIRVAIQLRRNSRITTITSTSEPTRVHSTSSTEAPM
ncbi:hypothetical protein NB706_002214 [Xanthomonas sacchari]|nr:hypothetical protein [Xanthomonas sacchari]